MTSSTDPLPEPAPTDDVVRGALSCVQRIVAGFELAIDAGGHDGWCWIADRLDQDELRRMLDAGEDIEKMPTIPDVAPCTEDELRAMQYVHDGTNPLTE